MTIDIELLLKIFAVIGALGGVGTGIWKISSIFKGITDAQAKMAADLATLNTEMEAMRERHRQSEDRLKESTNRRIEDFTKSVETRISEVTKGMSELKVSLVEAIGDLKLEIEKSRKGGQ